MQLGGVRSTSQVAKSFIGTGLTLELEFEAESSPAMLNDPKLDPEVPKMDPELAVTF